MNRLTLLLISCVAVLPACSNNTEEADARKEEPYVPLDRLDSPAYADSTYTGSPSSDLGTADSTYTSASSSQDEVLTPSDSSYDAGARTHTVRKGETLYALARRYYNDQARWRDIWNANRSQVPNPDKLGVGTQLRIP